jgi:hypothetical protein
MNLGSIWDKLDSMDRKLIHNLMANELKYNFRQYASGKMIFFDSIKVSDCMKNNLNGIKVRNFSTYAWCDDEVKRCKRIIKLIEEIS